jgi:hypothetical protein
MKKKIHSNPIQKYNKLFKFLSFDLNFFSCLLIAIIILAYMFAIAGIFFLLNIKEGSSIF